VHKKIKGFGALIVATLAVLCLFSLIVLGTETPNNVQGIILLYADYKTVMIPYWIESSLNDDDIGVMLQLYCKIPTGSEIYIGERYAPEDFQGMNYKVEAAQLPKDRQFIGAQCFAVSFGLQIYTLCDPLGAWFELFSLPQMIGNPSKDIPHSPINVDGSTNKLVFIKVPDGRWLMITLPDGQSKEGFCRAKLYEPVLPINP
jgi:hypothetical protein